jgi:hypothetical protein
MNVNVLNAISNTYFPGPINGNWFHSREEALKAYKDPNGDDDSVLEKPILINEFKNEDWDKYKIDKEAIISIYSTLFGRAIVQGDTPKRDIRDMANKDRASLARVLEVMAPYLK